MNYIFTSKTRNICFVLIAIGVVSIVGGFIADSHRVWPSLLLNSFYFMAIALGALFFMAVQYAAEAGWSAVVKRPMEAIASYLPVGAAFMAIVTILSALHFNHIYHWADSEVTDASLNHGHHYDEIIAGKSSFLNAPFFIIRTLIYLGGWILFLRAFMKKSQMEGSQFFFF